MIIQSRRPRIVSIKKEQPAPVKKVAAPAPTVRISEKPQPKMVKPEVKQPKVETKPIIKAESQVEEKKIEDIEFDIPKKQKPKRSLLEEVLEEQAALDD